MKRLAVAWCFAVSAAAQTPSLTHGPFRGHVDTSSLHVWARASEPGEFALEVVDVVGDGAQRAFATATAEHDNTLHFVVSGLRAATSFGLRIRSGDAVVYESAAGAWSAAIADDAAAATIVFGSCAEERRRPEQAIWSRILERRPDALVLLGDTPYIDDGTLAGRRRRYREFFAFEPVARTLAAIPTWSTWDDHDYATNDVFGKIRGGDVARGVFVDYHAHASYGDGTHGIHTSFRRGPIEVFLLDTRTFADTESSVLAPNERTLLGKAQTEWLQRGLAASTAPFKVLACGMVWNAAVRNGKADCWGNWIAERDALLRWIGANDVRGVVLVSGDVHRSRVILHPVAALAGYDVPEFVSSPLAQDVMESNRVDGPGLLFDAGEPESCLCLAVANGDLVATFVAGDGREFHRRTVEARELRRGDAADVYRRVETMLQDAFGADYARLPEQDYDVPAGVTAAGAVTAAWREAVVAATPALAEWAKASSFARCRFGATGRTEGTTEFFDRVVGLGHLRRIALARGHQAIADRDAAALAVTTDGLLALARHLFGEPTVVAWMFAHGAEDCAAELADRASAEWPETAATVRAALRRHLAGRPVLGAIAFPAEQECLRLLGLVLRGFEGDPGPKGAMARRVGADARQRAVAGLVEHLAPLSRLGNAPDPAVRDELVRREAAFRERCRDVLARVKDRKAADGTRPTDAADLADLLLSFAMPSVVDFLDQHAASLRRLESAAADR